MSSERKGRLARWAQRKAEVRRRSGAAAPTIPEEVADAPAGPSRPREAALARPDEGDQPAIATDLPDIETLTADSDFTVFMKDGVPAALRRLALRKLWASDPMFNVVDEMVEYGEDYTDAATVVAGMKSAWEAGRGYARNAGDAGGAEEKEEEEESPEAAQDDKGDDASEAQTTLDEGGAEEKPHGCG